MFLRSSNLTAGKEPIRRKKNTSFIVANPEKGRTNNRHANENNAIVRR
jgi:hypothetical protein